MKPTMNLFRNLSGWLFVFCLTLVLPGCCIDPVNGERYFCLGEVSDEDEAAMGQKYASSFIAESGGIYPDSQFNAFLGGIVIDKMARRSHRPSLPWTFNVLNTSEINAFALPGGQVFVTRGLLARLESEAQFAHLMGHEIGHVSHRHAIRGQGRGALLSILVGAVAIAEDQLTDPDEPPLITTAAGVLGQLTFLKFSRDQELQSDRRGVDYAVQAGYDPREGRKTFEMFLRLKEESGGENLLMGLLSTHPLDSRRIGEIDAYITETHPALPSDLQISSPQWSAQIAKLKSAHAVYETHDKALAMVARAQQDGNKKLLDDAERILQRGASSLPGHAAFPVGLGVIAMERGDYSSAEKRLGDACRLDPDLFNARLFRGLVYEKTSRLDLAAGDFRRAHELYSVHPLPCYHLGSVYKAKGDKGEAARWFEASLERSPRGSEVRRRSRAELSALAGS